MKPRERTKAPYKNIIDFLIVQEALYLLRPSHHTHA